MKKALLVTLDFPPNRGGVATYYQHLAAGLPAEDFFVLAPEQIGDGVFDKTVSYTVIREPLLRAFPNTWPQGIAGIFKLIKTVRWLLLVRSVRKVCRERHIDVVLVGQVLPIGTVAWLYWLLTKTPYIIFAHGMDITIPQHYLRKKRLLKKILLNARSCIVNSQFTREKIESLGVVSDQITVITPCPNEYVLKTDIVAEINRRYTLENKKIILTAGRIVERKGHDMVIKALPEILKQHPHTCYLIVGDGPYKDTLKMMARKYGVEKNVIFTGTLTDDELAACYSLADVFIMPSRELANGDVEGFGIVYLEANSFGKAVIGGNSGGVGEAVVDGQTGILVNPTSYEDVATAIKALLNNPELAHRLGSQGKIRIEKDFKWATRQEALRRLLV